MLTKLTTLGLASLLLAVTFLAGCATTTQPNSLTGNAKAIRNDKGMIVGYQAQ